jgi:hypothetical protein
MKLMETRQCLFELVGAGLEGVRDPSLGHPVDLIRQRIQTIRDASWTTEYADALAEGAAVICGLLKAYGGAEKWSEVALAVSTKHLL